MRRIAEERGGKCLSDRYVNCDTKLLWECAKGHQWKAIPTNVKRGSWCPYCAGVAKGTLEEVRRIAEARGGKGLADTYVNAKFKLLWECASGHRWKAAPGNIKNGEWCPYCAGLAKGTIEEMRRIAEARGGKCLSDTYVQSRVKLVWQCAKGHQWETTPSLIKRGSWCPTCARLKQHTKTF